MKKIFGRLLFVGVIAGGSIRGMEKLTGRNMLEEFFGSNDTVIASQDDHPHDGTEGDDHHHDHDNHIHDDSHPHDDGVLVVSPKHISQDELSEKTYVGTIYSPYYGQVYAFREGIIEKLYVDVGDTVKKGQSLGKLTSQTFVPELADMQASRQAEITSAQGGLQSAQLQLEYAINAKENYISSIGGIGQSLYSSRQTDPLVKNLEEQMENSAVQALGQINQLSGSLALLESQLGIKESELEIEEKKIQNEILTIEKQLAISKQKISGSIRFAYDQVTAVFFDGNYDSNFSKPERYFGARNTSVLNEFKQKIRQISNVMKNLESQSIDTQIGIIADLIDLIDQGILVLTYTVDGANYTENDLVRDKDRLIDAKLSDIAGLATIGGEIQLQQVDLQNKQVQLDQLTKQFELSKQFLALEKTKTQQEIDLARTQAKGDIITSRNDIEEKKRDIQLQDIELQSQQNDILNTLREYDKDIAEAEGNLRIAQADLRAAQQALGILQQGGYNNAITAPFNGTITKRFLTVGQTVNAETAIFDLVDSSKGEEKFVRFDVPEAEFDGLNKGQTIKFIRVQDPIRHYEARISRIANAIDQETKTILVEAELAENYEKVLLGGTVVVMFPQASNVALVPLTAVFEDEDGLLYLRKVVDDVIVKQLVETGKSIGDQIYITDGISQGDTIVSDASQVEGKETGDTISVVKGFQASEADQGLDALGDGHDHAH